MGLCSSLQPLRHEFDDVGPSAASEADQPQHTLPDSNAILTGREHLGAYLEPLALSPALTPLIRENTTVFCALDGAACSRKITPAMRGRKRTLSPLSSGR